MDKAMQGCGSSYPLPTIQLHAYPFPIDKAMQIKLWLYPVPTISHTHTHLLTLRGWEMVKQRLALVVPAVSWAATLPVEMVLAYGESLLALQQ